MQRPKFETLAEYSLELRGGVDIHQGNHGTTRRKICWSIVKVIWTA